MQSIERNCPICGNSGSSALFANAKIDSRQLDQFAFASRKTPEYMHHRLMICKACDLVYASPVPVVDELHAAYVDAAFDSGTEAAYAARTYGRIVDRLLSRLPSREGAVDIGAGDGAFLRELLDRNFQSVIGIEPSAAPIAAASPEIRPLIRSGIFEAGSMPAESCALVTCFQTIEHVSDPLEMCREVLRILKQGGAICLVGHNRRSLSARALGFRSPIFDIEHLQLFSKVSFRQLLSAAGFSQIQVFPFWNRYPTAYWTRLFPFPGPIKRLLLKSLTVTGCGKIPLGLPAGNLVAVGFKY
jgi:SAM-dependent methyltransferase